VSAKRPISRSRARATINPLPELASVFIMLRYLPNTPLCDGRTPLPGDAPGMAQSGFTGTERPYAPEGRGWAWL